MVDAFSWTCPFCDRRATITSSHYSVNALPFTNGNKYGYQYIRVETITCPNPACREYALRVSVHDYLCPQGGGSYYPGPVKAEWQLIPAANVKVFPDFVPAPILTDYEEACLIRGLSPKASATLARRCLQGMIRDFWGVRKSRLVDEIEAIKDKVDPLTWSAIDAVRSIGNIGAHMEKDINVDDDVDPGEAQLLIGLIETLINDWYIVKHEREQRLAQIIATAEQKSQTKLASKSSSLDPESPA